VKRPPLSRGSTAAKRHISPSAPTRYAASDTRAASFARAWSDCRIRWRASVHAARHSLAQRTSTSIDTRRTRHSRIAPRKQASADPQPTRSVVVRSDTVERVGSDDRFATGATLA
jgi:hypothetical protein